MHLVCTQYGDVLQDCLNLGRDVYSDPQSERLAIRVVKGPQAFRARGKSQILCLATQTLLHAYASYKFLRVFAHRANAWLPVRGAPNVYTCRSLSPNLDWISYAASVASAPPSECPACKPRPAIIAWKLEVPGTVVSLQTIIPNPCAAVLKQYMREYDTRVSAWMDSANECKHALLVEAGF